LKLLTSITLTLLLFVVAFAGLSPPTEKQNRQTFHAATVRPPLIAEQAVQVERVALAVSNLNLMKPANIGINLYRGRKAMEVRPVARNGSCSTAASNLNLYSSHGERDIGSVLLL
jgi:hypothetical protein